MGDFVVDFGYIVGAAALAMGLLIADWQRRREMDENEILRARLDAAQRHRLIDSAPCPLCTYEDGKLLARCGYHTDIDSLANVPRARGWTDQQLRRLADELDKYEGKRLYHFVTMDGRLDEAEWFATDEEALAHGRALGDAFTLRMIG